MWIAAFLLPIAVAVAIGLLSAWSADRSRGVRHQLVRFSWLGVIPAGAALVTDDGQVHAVDWMLLGTAVQVDAVGAPLAFLTVGLYGLALAFVVRSKSDRPHVLTAFLLLCFTGNLGVFVAENIPTFYLMFAAMSFLGYAIVVHDRSASARRAAAIYLVMTVFGESAVLAALLFIAAEGAWTLDEAPAAVASSDFSGLIILLLLIGFGVKAGTVPLHIWLPLAHPAAPSPASAVLSGTMLKAGIIGWLRFLPLGEGAGEPVWGGVFLALAIAGGLLAVPVGLLQDNPKVILAYSSIGQMGFLTILVGVALWVPELAAACIAATVVYSVAHGLIKGALFLGVQSWDSERLTRWAVAIPLGIAGLALAGAPLTAGYIGKYAAKEAVGDVTIAGPLAIPIADVLPLTALGSTLLLARFAVVMWRRPREPKATAWTRDIAWAVLCVGAVVPVAMIAEQLSPPLSVPGWFDPATLWAQSWPILLGAGAAVATALLGRQRERSRVLHPRGDIIPSGDILYFEERAAKGVLRGLVRAGDSLGVARRAVIGQARRLPSPVPAIDRSQRALGVWSASGLAALVLLAAALAVAALWGGGG